MSRIFVALCNAEHLCNGAGQWVDTPSYLAQDASRFDDVGTESLKPGSRSIDFGLQGGDTGIERLFFTIIQLRCVDNLSNLSKQVRDFPLGDSVKGD